MSADDARPWGFVPPASFPVPNESHRLIRITFVMAWLVVGGEETEIRLLARTLPRDRYRIDVIPCFRKEGMPEQTHRQLAELGVAVDTLPYALGFDDTVDYLRRRLAGADVVVSCQNVADIYPALERMALRPPLIEHGGLVSEALAGPKHLTSPLRGRVRQHPRRSGVEDAGAPAPCARDPVDGRPGRVPAGAPLRRARRARLSAPMRSWSAGSAGSIARSGWRTSSLPHCCWRRTRRRCASWSSAGRTPSCPSTPTSCASAPCRSAANRLHRRPRRRAGPAGGDGRLLLAVARRGHAARDRRGGRGRAAGGGHARQRRAAADYRRQDRSLRRSRGSRRASPPRCDG